MSEFHDQIARYRAAIEAFLQAQFCQELPQKRLFDAMRYSLLAGGKRIRPVLTLEFCRICGGDWQSARSLCLRARNGPYLQPHPRRSALHGQ